MALRPPPRAPPFTDFDELIVEMKSQFNIEVEIPEKAKSEWRCNFTASVNIIQFAQPKHF